MNRIYAIDGENRVQRVDAVGKPIEGAFASLEEFALLVTDWPLRRLVEIWNKLPGVRPLSRFENRGVAVHRIWCALHSDQQPARAQRPLRRRRVRESKTQLVLRLLRQPEGATLKELMKATQWQAHSVRGFLSAKIIKKRGLPLVSTKREGERVYCLLQSALAN